MTLWSVYDDVLETLLSVPVASIARSSGIDVSLCELGGLGG